MRNWKKLILVLILALGMFQGKANETTYEFLHFTNQSGLPSSYVKSITQDQHGFIWLATRISLSRFDGLNYQSFPVFNVEGKAVEIFCNQVFMYADTLLVTRTNNGAYYYFDEKRECFYPYGILNSTGVLESVAVASDGYWILQSGTLYFLNGENGKTTNLVEYFPSYILPFGLHIDEIIFEEDVLWAQTDANTILSFNVKTKKVTEYKIPEILNNKGWLLSFVDFEDHLWLSNENAGLIRFNPEDSGISRFNTGEKKGRYIPHNLIHCFTTDHQNRIWIGTEAGLLIYTPATDQSDICRYELSNPKGLNTDPIYDAFCDKDGNIWLGTYFGGINFWKEENSFFRTWEAGSGNWRLGGNVVSCFEGDNNGNLWIGLEDLGLNNLDMKSGKVTKYSSGHGLNGLSYDNLHDLLLIDEKELWIATYTGGINILDIKTRRFRHLYSENTPGLSSDIIYKFHRSGDSIFIGTSLGIDVYDLKKKQFKSLKQQVLGEYQFESIAETDNKLWFSSTQGVYCYDKASDSIRFFDRIPELKNINFVKADSRNNIWIGDCYQGVSCYNIDNETLKVFNRKNGFPASWIFSLEEGEEGWYWASSDKGLVKFHPVLGLSILYDSNSGIPFNQFNYRASYTDSDGNIYFGGNNGMVSFNETANPMLLKHTDVVFTGLQLFNKPVYPGDNSPLTESLNSIDQLKLKYDQNVFTIEYSALTYSLQGRCQYAYYLEGFEEEWNEVGNRTFATYTNLSPGKYTFHVKGSTNNLSNESNERVLQIKVLPPFWMSKWAFLVYFVMAWLFSVLLYRFGKYLEKSRALVEMERREKEHAEEIHNVKLEFFTNISHELKTPLTLILGPLSRILDEEKLSPASKKRLLGIEKNARRLFNLIDQLLEFRKIEKGKEQLAVSGIEVKTFGEEIAKAFESIVESKDIEFVTSFPVEGKMGWFDANKVDKIIFNLLSNAFKYTPPGGRIEFTMELVKKNLKSRNPGHNLLVTITDTGKGIKAELLDKVFERFFQSEINKPEMHSSGIGLAFVKSLVMLHCGTVDVESERGVGTTFKVKIPASKKDYTENDLCANEVQVVHSEDSDLMINETPVVSKEPDVAAYSRKPVVLLVEDNLEVIDFIKDVLEADYQVVQAHNGEEALEKIEKIVPELIVSDVMMPKMDGFELCTRLKEDIKTSHIPVILLTAKSGVENHLKGLNTGADFYIQKPFLPELLVKNIKNILNTRQRLIERFKNDTYIEVSDVAVSESDKQFVEKLTKIIKDNISSDFDVTFLVKEMGLSRSLIHMKLKSLVNCSTTEFIRSVRVKEATKLIAEGKCNISEAAYEVGFSSPTYFTRRFKELYGKSPREYFNQNSK